MICLKNLARNHSIAILTSIHQPNNDVLMLFDQLYILSSRGQCIYNGHPSVLKHHLIQCEVPFVDHQVPIEQILKIATLTDSNFDLIDNLLNKMNANLVSQIELWKNEGNLLERFYQKKKTFSLTDLMILLRRTINNELIGGWKLELAFLINYFLIIFIMLNLYPDDIASDSGCIQEVTDLQNISSINQKILDAIIGNEQKCQQNIKFYFYIMDVIYLTNMIQLCYSYEAKVIFIYTVVLRFCQPFGDQKFT